MYKECKNRTCEYVKECNEVRSKVYPRKNYLTYKMSLEYISRFKMPNYTLNKPDLKKHFYGIEIKHNIGMQTINLFHMLRGKFFKKVKIP